MSIDYAKYEGHIKCLSIRNGRDITDEGWADIPELKISVTDWSDADLALHLDAPALLERCKELEGRLRQIANANWVDVNSSIAATRMKKLAQDALKEGK